MREPVAIATLVKARGSGPCPVGSKLYVGAGGAMEGSVSGGCVEAAVIREAEEVAASGRPRLVSYEITDDDAFAVGLPCGGAIEVLIEPADRDLLERLEAVRAAGESAVLLTRLTDARHILLGDGEMVSSGLAAAARAALRADRPAMAEHDGERWFVDPVAPPVRLVVVGGSHIAQALIPMARTAGLRPVLVDPRARFASPERFPDTEIINQWPNEVLPDLLGPRAALVTLTHDAKLDDPALACGLRSRAFYVGALGSRRTHAARRDRLREAGFGPADLARVRGPVGLAIGAANPAEIAVSILGQIVETLRRPAPRIGAVILAAGSSRRMGERNKLVADVRGAPVVRRAVEAAVAAGCAPVAVVTGHEAERIEEALAGLPVELVHNEEHALGMGRSIAAGIAAVAGRVDAVFVALGDMPHVGSRPYQLLREAFAAEPGGIFVPEHEGRRGHPVLWPAGYFAELQELSADVGGRELLGRHAAVVRPVEVGTPAIHIDIDDPSDLA